MNSICGVDCTQCGSKDICGGCAKTNGYPFHGACIVASCCQNEGYQQCNQCLNPCKLRKQLTEEFHSLGITELEGITDLNALKGSYINLKVYPPQWTDREIVGG